MPNNFSILTICTGNICRSPLAGQLLARQLRDVPEIHVSSAGTRALVGHPMPQFSLEIASSYGVDNPESHRARQMTETALESSDLIFAMNREHRRAIVELSPRVTRRVFTIREFARLAEVTTDEDIASEIGSSEALPADYLKAAVRAVMLGRSALQPLVAAAEDDVIDPYRRVREFYAVSAQQLTPAVDATVALLRRVLERVV